MSNRSGGGPSAAFRAIARSVALLTTVAVTGLLAIPVPVRGETPAVPVVVSADQPTLRLQFLGRYQGDVFRPKVVRTPPAYDPASKRLFAISLERRAIEILDIANPARPARVGAITDPSGHLGVATTVLNLGDRLAVSFIDRTGLANGQVAFFTLEGTPVGEPVPVGVQPWVMVASPDGRHLVVANVGESIMGIDPKGSVSIITLDRSPVRGEPAATEPGKADAANPSSFAARAVTLDFRSFERHRDALIAKGLRLGKPGNALADVVEPLSVAVTPDSRLAWVTLGRNNALARVTLDPPAITDIFALGTKDFSQPGYGLDASDEDGAVRIRPWPVYGLFQPDGIGVIHAADRDYLITANPGDAWDDAGDGKDLRVADLKLDPSAFPDPTIKEPANLGRLRVSHSEGDIDADGNIGRLYAFGARSFAIWSSTADLVFDSGDALEQITARAFPRNFNAPDDTNTFDACSSTRGPEPQRLTVTEIGERTYAFITLERIGGIVAYDVTDPRAPRFETYINSRNFAVDPETTCRKGKKMSTECRAAGDLKPETVSVIPATESPIGAPLLIATFKATDSIAIFRIETATTARP